jgi:hypothetical protein
LKPDVLKRAIDRMVEDSIRRILPSVMNEVLIKTIASSGVMTERAPVRTTTPQAPRKVKAPQPKRRVELSDLLDPMAGADFYEDPRNAYRQQPVQESFEQEDDPEEEAPPITRRLTALPPALQELAEGMTLDDDDGEMWGADEHDSVPMNESTGPGIVTDPTPIRDVNRAAKAVGIDFSRMKNVIAQTTPPKRVDREDAAAEEQFQRQRLRMMREKLNGGKSVE